MILKIARISYDPVIIYASEELKRCLEKMDPSLHILLLTYPQWRGPWKNTIWLGQDPMLEKELPEVENSELDDAIAINVQAGEGYITGANPRAVLIAAFRFLRELGAAWVRPKDGEILPACDVYSRSVSVKEAPSCRHRGICIEGAVSLEHVTDMIDWMPRVGLNAYFNQFWIPATFYERWYEHQQNPTMEDYPITLDEVEGLRDTTVYEIKRRGLLYHATGHGWTCEPFGISGTGWDPERTQTVPEEAKQYLALVNGKRELWGNIPLNTNLCYSNPVVRRTISQSVADYCTKTPEADYLHVWLADGSNNHCECESCIQKRPSDWYIDLLNEIDEEMSAKNLKAKIVFLMYCDLYWPPVETKLNNPDRFVLMFAPITRTYTHSLTEAADYDAEKLPEYIRNQCVLPKSVEENLCWLEQWKKFFGGDSFDFDYHYMWDHHKDFSHISMNRVLFEDMKGLRKLKLNGMVSCQNQRVWLPSGFGMAAMAAALWDREADFDTVAKQYFLSAFGADGVAVFRYLEDISTLSVPSYLRKELGTISSEAAESIGKIPAKLAAFETVIRENCAKDLPDAQRRSWEYLSFHREICARLAPAVQKQAEGNTEEASALFKNFKDYLQKIEPEIADALDVCLMITVLSGIFH